MRILLLFFLIFPASSILATPATFSYQGRLFNDSGDPIDTGTSTIVLQILNPSANCLLFEEYHNVLMDNTGGYFRIAVGLGTKNTATAPSFAFKSIFSNLSTFNDANLQCASYTPAVNDYRLLRVNIDGETLVPDHTITSTPYSLQSQDSSLLEGKSYSDIISYADSNFAGSTLPDLQASPLTSGDSFQWDGSKWITFKFAAADLPTNSVTLDDVNFASSNGISVPSLNAAPGSPGAGQIYYNSVDNKIYFHNGTTWVDVTATSGGDFKSDGSIAMGARLNLNGNYLSGDGDAEGIFVDAVGSVGIGTTTPNSAAILDVSSSTQGILPPRMTTVQRDTISTPPVGLTIYNTDNQVLEIYNGAFWAQMGNSIPSGAVMAFNGNSCPTGWTAYTNARDRVIVGSGGSYSLETLGGADSATSSSDGNHDHGGTTGSHALTSNELPTHAHTVDPPATATSLNGNHSHGLSSGTTGFAGGSAANGFQVAGSMGFNHQNIAINAAGNHAHTLDIGAFSSSSVGNGSAHDHTVTNEPVHSHSVDVRQKYVALLFCQFIGGTPAATVYTPVNKTGDTMTGVLNLPSDGLKVGTDQFIVDGGNVGIGTTSTTHKLNVVGTAGLSTGTAWTNTSDIRLKDIRGDYEYGLEAILKLNTVRFNYKKDNPLSLPSDKEIVGFIAQEVREVIPEAIVVRDDGFLELNVDPIHWASLNAIQELNGKCEMTQQQIEEFSAKSGDQDSEIAALRQKVTNLEARLRVLEKFISDR